MAILSSRKGSATQPSPSFLPSPQYHFGQRHVQFPRVLTQCNAFVQLLRVGSLHSLMSANQVENIIMNAHNIYTTIIISKNIHPKQNIWSSNTNLGNHEEGMGYLGNPNCSGIGILTWKGGQSIYYSPYMRFFCFFQMLLHMSRSQLPI